MRPQISFLIQIAALMALSASAWAEPFLKLVETEYTDGPVKVRIRVPNLLIFDVAGKPHLALDPLGNPDHARVIDILRPGIPIDQENIRDDIASLLAQFPQPCLNGPSEQGLSFALLVSPIEDIDRFVPDVIDKRRITSVYLSRCLAETPKACLYSQKYTGAVDFDIGSLRRVLRECRDATNAAVEGGARYFDATQLKPPTE